ncbi:MAG: sigma 54 modulation/S30EA ribosomal C-terminal domain-containing protein, partial [Acidobacteria bacterium]|nr:sigma 54 modulation/S30EA ribosomal C-terminal domain-containing protein [Acidobacteriota bacterium]
AEDAALRVEKGAESFVVFRNADTDAISILYRRTDGNLGLIEPE